MICPRDRSEIEVRESLGTWAGMTGPMSFSNGIGVAIPQPMWRAYCPGCRTHFSLPVVMHQGDPPISQSEFEREVDRLIRARHTKL